MDMVKKMMRFIVFFTCLCGLRGNELGLRGSGRGVATRQLAESKSCEGGLAVDVTPPWESMDVRVTGASSVDQCKACAKQLEGQGDLMSGWECYTSWWRVYLRRSGDLTMTPIKPIQSFKIDDVQVAGPLAVGEAPLPAALRGVFWLSDQKTQSALVTFAPNNQADCEWCSYGKLIANRYLVRVSGDKTWTFATEESAGYDLARGLRLAYDFSFDSATNPTYATIYPIPTRMGRVGERLSQQTWLLNFDMTLLSSEEAASKGYPGSVVWERKSYALGVELKSSRYDIVQVVDEDGNRIKDAWEKFVVYQGSSDTGDEPGTLYYHGDA